MLAEQTKTAAVVLIELPQDQYRHEGAPTEWWWHIGTLRADDGRKFGFEVNAVGVISPLKKFCVAMAAISDVKAQKHFSGIQYMDWKDSWAEIDQSKPFAVQLSDPAHVAGNVSIDMASPEGNIYQMSVRASFVDAESLKTCQLRITLEQQGEPLYVWGTGRTDVPVGPGPLPVQLYNFYYSFTRLQAVGTIEIDGEVIGVKGTTWMDHEYGVFSNPDGTPVQWMLQDMQFPGGLHLSNYTIVKGGKFALGDPMNSHATMLTPEGQSIYVNTRTTPTKAATVDGKEYFMQFKVELLDGSETPIFYIVDCDVTDQVFRDPMGLNTGYEGSGTTRMYTSLSAADGTQREVLLETGDAWIEEMLYTKLPTSMF